MELGFFSPEIHENGVEAVFAKAHELGFTQTQYDFITSHGEEMPEAFFPDELERVADAARKYNIRIVAINGTFNMIDDDMERREEYIRRFTRIAQAAAYLKCPMITLCTGSKSPEGMWRYHPYSASEYAWGELIDTTKKLMPVAEEYDVTFGVETEASNVVFTPERARRYMDEMGSSRLKVIMDCANLFPAGTAKKENMAPTIRRAFDLLGKDVMLAHGKDILEDEKVRFTSPAMGIVDYELYFNLLKEIGYKDGFILHGLHKPEEFEPSIAAIRAMMEKVGI